MKLILVSDTHGYYPEIPEGDIFIHAGDFSAGRGTVNEFYKFLEWVSQAPCKHKIFIAGNHDMLLEAWGYDRVFSTAESYGVTYLQNTGIEIEGLKIWGSPETPEFYDWAFMYKREGRVWDIPDCDILVTHGPPFGIHDYVRGGANQAPYNDSDNVGCKILRWVVEKIRPQIHLFGHIHTDGKEEYMSKVGETLFINASYVDNRYKPNKELITIDYVDNL